MSRRAQGGCSHKANPHRHHAHIDSGGGSTLRLIGQRGLLASNPSICQSDPQCNSTHEQQSPIRERQTRHGSIRGWPISARPRSMHNTVWPHRRFDEASHCCDHRLQSVRSAEGIAALANELNCHRVSDQKIGELAAKMTPVPANPPPRNLPVRLSAPKVPFLHWTLVEQLSRWSSVSNLLLPPVVILSELGWVVAGKDWCRSTRS